jgi:membrane protein DedA with SNARE-associated domain
MESLILDSLSDYQFINYLAAFLGMVFEGDTALFIISFLTSQGFFDFFTIVLVVFFGTFFGDLLWYWFGLKVKNGSFIKKWADRIAIPFDNHLIKRNFRILFISKFTYGIHHALLVRAGILKMNFETIVRNVFVSTIFWVPIIGSIGYFSGISAPLFKKYLKYTEVILLLFVLAFILVSHYISRCSKKNL